jgi:DNA-binding transcriptional regulator LsrR (DeoR family)
MPRPDESTTIESLKMAYCSVILGMDGEQIAKKFRSTTTTVSRRLQLARNESWIETKTHLCVPENWREQVYSQVSKEDLAKKIQDPLGTNKLPRLIVVPSEKGEEKGEDEENRRRVSEENRRRVSRAAAYRLSQWLSQEMPSQFSEDETIYIGISWGRTMREMVEFFPTVFSPPVPNRLTVEIIPLCGDFLLAEEAPLRRSSSMLAEELSEVVQGKEGMWRFNLPFPAFLPKGVDRKAILDFLERYRAFKNIFGTRLSQAPAGGSPGDKPVLERLHGLLTSVGDQKAEDFHEDYIDNQDKAALVGAGMVGDLLGNFITADQVEGFPPESPLTQMNDRFLGAKPHHLRLCAAQARRPPQKLLGVVIAAHGCAKAAPLLSAINAGCVTEAIIDEELAEAIVKLPNW